MPEFGQPSYKFDGFELDSARFELRRDTERVPVEPQVLSLLILLALGLGSLRRRTILLIGAGAMAQTAIKALRARHYDRINIANRTVERAQALVAEWQGKAYDLDNLLPALAEADVVFSATHAQRALLTADLMARTQELRGGRPIMKFETAWQKVRERSGMLDLQMRDLRRTAATYAAMSGAPASPAACHRPTSARSGP